MPQQIKSACLASLMIWVWPPAPTMERTDLSKLYSDLYICICYSMQCTYTHIHTSSTYTILINYKTFNHSEDEDYHISHLRRINSCASWHVSTGSFNYHLNMVSFCNSHRAQHSALHMMWTDPVIRCTTGSLSTKSHVPAPALPM